MVEGIVEHMRVHGDGLLGEKCVLTGAPDRELVLNGLPEELWVVGRLGFQGALAVDEEELEDKAELVEVEGKANVVAGMDIVAVDNTEEDAGTLHSALGQAPILVVVDVGSADSRQSWSLL